MDFKINKYQFEPDRDKYSKEFMLLKNMINLEIDILKPLIKNN